jgi:hypothetical protein
MTGNLLFDLLISAGGVAALVALSFALGALKSATVDEAVARERLSFDEPDFQPARWLVDAKGRAAAAIDHRGGEAAFVFAIGDGVGTRRMRLGAVNASAEGSAVTVLLGDLTRRKLLLAAPTENAAKEWAALLQGQKT